MYILTHHFNLETELSSIRGINHTGGCW